MQQKITNQVPKHIEILSYAPQVLLRQSVSSDLDNVLEMGQIIDCNCATMKLGYWSANGAGTIEISKYLLDEICIVLCGQVEITDTNGAAACFNPEDVFRIKRGFTGCWKMHSGFRKFFIACGSEEEIALFASVVPPN